MKRVLLFICVVILRCDSQSPIASSTVKVYPCKNTEDITAWIKPGLPLEEYTDYNLDIKKSFPANSVVKFSFDAEVNITFGVKSENNQFSRITLSDGDIFTLRFSTQQEGLGLEVRGKVPGLNPNVKGLTIDNVEHCTEPDVGFVDKYANTGKTPQQEKYQWRAEIQRSEKADVLRNCGRRMVTSERIEDGPAQAGYWPWFAAIYDIQTRTSLRYNCGGTLISKSFVLTAGYCTVNRKPKDVLVVIGIYHAATFGPDVQRRNVKEIITAKNYKSADYDDQLSLLRLAQDVPFSSNIQPACLWPNAAAGPLVGNVTGAMVGWGYDDDDQQLESLLQANLPLVSDHDCIQRDPVLYKRRLNGHTFCAGYLGDGASTCEGDGGIAFLVFTPDKVQDSTGQDRKVTGSWQVKGILSRTVRPPGEPCTQSYTLFTDVEKYWDWIHRYLDN
ncbi:transmembrane protease serine 11A [Bicyclus anynana]|uniref:Transmembrane protease serine 11A n=1 Tax=Bicyclus anynana TaxID=110368 RepID=A0A6J1N9D7_BICAN|nr:transmembrane protease serine 11A [Bicyclus anynana]